MGVEERLDDLKLDTSAFQILCYLSFKDAPMKPGEIAREIGQNPSASGAAANVPLVVRLCGFTWDATHRSRAASRRFIAALPAGMD